MSLTARALSIPTGHPVLKLVLLAVAAAPGWPAAGDVAELAEIPPDWAQDALTELVRRGHLTAHPCADVVRYGMPDDGWTYTRTDTAGGAADEVPADASLAALETGEIGGYPMAAPRRAARTETRP